MKKVFRNIFQVLKAEERKQFFLVYFLVSFSTIIQLAGVTSIIPFLSLFAKKESIYSNQYLNKFFHIVGADSESKAFTYLAIVILVIICSSNLFGFLSLKAKVSYSLKIEKNLSLRIFNWYLHKNYLFFTEESSPKLITNIITETSRTTRVISETLNLLINFSIIAFVGTLIIFVDPIIVLGLGFGFGLIYFAIFKLIKGKIYKNGLVISKISVSRYKLLGEFFPLVKEMFVYNKLGHIFINLENLLEKFRSAKTSNQIIMNSPRFLLETFSIGGVVIVLLYYVQSGVSFVEVLPKLSFFAVVSYKLLPLINNAFSALSRVKEDMPAFDNVINELKLSRKLKHLERIPHITPAEDFNILEIQNLAFRYNEDKVALHDLNLIIKKHEVVGIAGASGSGKTTLLNILLGLMKPSAGDLRVNRKSITNDSKIDNSWRAYLGFVPQDIFLIDDTVIANIALGDNNPDIEKVKKVAGLANLDPIIAELENGLETRVGDRGVQLSGGQRQRVGIARALYRDAQFLIFDEATSALDGETEEEVMKAINLVSSEKTVVIVAHRLSTLKDCNVIYLMNEGKIVEQGSYSELESNSDYFKKLNRSSVENNYAQ